MALFADVSTLPNNHIHTVRMDNLFLILFFISDDDDSTMTLQKSASEARMPPPAVRMPPPVAIMAIHVAHRPKRTQDTE